MQNDAHVDFRLNHDRRQSVLHSPNSLLDQTFALVELLNFHLIQVMDDRVTTNLCHRRSLLSYKFLKSAMIVFSQSGFDFWALLFVWHGYFTPCAWLKPLPAGILKILPTRISYF
jgi:hypothetical protein